VFASTESLVPGDTNSTTDVYLRDRQAATTTLVSATLAGVVFSGDSFRPSLSGDGRVVAFKQFGNLWLLDRQAGTLVNECGAPGVQPNAGCDQPRISRTGRFLVFESYASNLVDLGGQTFVTHFYLRDLSQTGK
jgi:Tol biopolymer transport system component